MPPFRQQGQPGVNQDHMQAKETLHQIAAQMTAGHLASLQGQVPQGAFDPTFQSQALQTYLQYAVGIYKTYYAWICIALNDPSWGDPVTTPAPVTQPAPTQPAPTQPTQPVATQPVATQPVATSPVATSPAPAAAALSPLLGLVSGMLGVH